MELLQYLPFLSVFLLAVLGVGSLCFSMAVWRRRRHAMQNRSPRVRFIQSVALLVGALGSLVLMLSLCLRSFFPRQGELFVRDSVVVRADPAKGLPTLSERDELEAGDKLVLFQRPGQQAEIERLRLEAKRLEAEASRMREAHVSIDPSLIREHQELVAERRHLLQRGDLFRVEEQRLEQQARSDLLDKKVQQHEIHVELAEYAGRIRKLKSELTFETLRLESAQGMRREAALSEIGYAERQRNIDVVKADLERLAREKTDKQALLEALNAGIVSLEQTLGKYEARMLQRTSAVASESAAVSTRRRDLDLRIVKDRVRVRRARDTKIQEIITRRMECLKKLEKVEAEAHLLCPTAGQVLYRHPSPQSAATGEPIVMFGPPHAVRARFRLPAHEARRLARDESVDLLATSHELLESRLAGRVSAHVPVEHEPGIVLAEFECQAAPGQLAFLSRGLTLDARLLWAPPVLADPLFLFGVFLILLALVPSMLWHVGRRGRPVVPVPRPGIKPSVPRERVRSG